MKTGVVAGWDEECGDGFQGRGTRGEGGCRSIYGRLLCFVVLKV